MRHARVRLVAALVSSLTVAAVACGDDGSSGDSSGGGNDLGARIAEAGASIESEWGERDGFAVTLLAADRGYSVGQIRREPGD